MDSLTPRKSRPVQLLPYPFCGHDDIEVAFVERLRNWVPGCRICSAERGQHETKADAIAALNTRVKPPKEHGMDQP